MARITVAEIDLSAIAYNLHAIQGLIGSDVEIISIVKSDAYGHGLIPVARTLASEGVRTFAVAALDEAAELQDAGIPGRIVLLGALMPEQIGETAARNLEPMVGDMETAVRLSEQAVRFGRAVSVHIKFDTGMGRLGFPAERSDILPQINSLPGLRIAGVMSHFACADDVGSVTFTRDQIRRFASLNRYATVSALRISSWHTANSAALLSYPESHFTAVRPGLALYGSYRSMRETRPLALRQAMTLKTRIAQIRNMPEGATISYGCTFQTKRPSRIAILPVGYADGYNRLLSNRGQVLVRGARAPVVGRVCMDMTLIDVTEVPEACAGDEVVLFGRQEDRHLAIAEICDLIATIPHLVMTSVSSRVRRVYHHSPRAISAGAPTR